jgi:hypothetical protein
MPAVTLLARVYDSFQQKAFEKDLKAKFEGLQVAARVYAVTGRGWVQIDVSGEDEKVALRLLTDEVGACPEKLDNLNKFVTINGRIIALNKNRDKLYVDIGVFSPNVVDAAIQLHHLQAQLIDGRKGALKKITELYGFRDNLPINLKILSVDKENDKVEAAFSERQLVQYRNWTLSLLDRLIVLGASVQDVMCALKAAECERDVVEVEPLGFSEHAIVCKLGTDATGLIPKIGGNLRKATFTIFSPRRLTEFLGTEP